MGGVAKTLAGIVLMGVMKMRKAVLMMLGVVAVFLLVAVRSGEFDNQVEKVQESLADVGIMSVEPKAFVKSGIADRYEVSFVGEPVEVKGLHGDTPYWHYNLMTNSSLQTLAVYYHEDPMSDEEAANELNVGAALGIPDNLITDAGIEGAKGVRYPRAGSTCLLIVVDNQYVVSLIGVGNGAQDFIDSFKMTEYH